MARILRRRALSLSASRVLQQSPPSPHVVARRIPHSVRSYCSDSSSIQRRPGPLAMYRRMVEAGNLQFDTYQEKVARELEELMGKLENYEKEMEEYHVNLSEWESNRENHRKRLLLDEAELKQEAVDNENSLGNKVGIRKGRIRAEPGVGRMVSYLNREKQLDLLLGSRPIAPVAPKGIYLYGNVGSGKTMLMDMFYRATEGVVKHRRRFHFHEAMLVIHELMHEIWKNKTEEYSHSSSITSWIYSLPFDKRVKEWLIGEERYKEDAQMKHILPAVADKFLIDRKTDLTGASILCFDEIQTVDVFAVVALSGILSRLLNNGTILVATSNRAPEDLNQDGMQQDIFLKLVSKLEGNCNRVFIGNEIDYRCLIPIRKSDEICYFWPTDSSITREFDSLWHGVARQDGGEIISETIPVLFGRKLEVPESCNGIARFHFEYLCGQPMGAADYIALAKNFHTVFILDIPRMSMRIRDKARRFITLIDELYNHHCCLYCSAATSIEELFQGTEEGRLFDLESFQFETEIEDGKLRRNVLAAGNVGSGGAPAAIVSILSGQEEMFAFRRAVSRLIEMQTPLYLEGVRTLHPYFERQKRAAHP